MAKGLAIGTDPVQAEGVVRQHEVFPPGDFILQSLYGFILKFFDPPALHAHDMIVMAALVEFKNRDATLEVMADDKTGGLELSQYPVYRRETYLVTLGSQVLGYFLSAQMAVGGTAPFENFQYFEARERDLESRISDVFAFQGDCSARCFKLPDRV